MEKEIDACFTTDKAGFRFLYDFFRDALLPTVKLCPWDAHCQGSLTAFHLEVPARLRLKPPQAPSVTQGRPGRELALYGGSERHERTPEKV